MSLAFQKVGGSRGVAQCHSHPYTSPIRRLISLEAAGCCPPQGPQLSEDKGGGLLG